MRIERQNDATSVANLIADRIRESGPIGFDTFMEMALYHPELGYYEQPDLQIGRHGDFMTSVSVGPAFGTLLGFYFANYLERINGRVLIESGAHDGQLARDILEAAKRWNADLEYWILEPSKTRRSRQRRTLAPFQNQVRWLASLEDIPDWSVHGIFFSNELLDAMPVQSFRWRAKTRSWTERRVDWTPESRFHWVEAPINPTDLPERFAIPEDLAAVIPDGFLAEVSCAACDWWRTAAAKLALGQALAIDYGWSDAQWLQPERAHGTLRAYFRHQIADNLLDRPGKQDLTYSVAFPDIEAAGRQAGLAPASLQTQSKFLTKVAESWWTDPNAPKWDPNLNRAFLTLTDPNQFGTRFHAFQQEVPSGRA